MKRLSFSDRGTAKCKVSKTETSLVCSRSRKKDSVALAGWLSWLEDNSHAPKGSGFDPKLGHAWGQPILYFCFTLMCFSLSLPLSLSISLPSSLSKISKYILGRELL